MLLRTPQRLFRWSYFHLISWLSWFSWSSWAVITTIGNKIIIVFMIIMLFPAPLPANAEQHLCREQQHDHLPHSHRHHLATLHCQTNPEKGAFFRSARSSCTTFDWPNVGKIFFSVLFLFHKIMDYNDGSQMAWHAKCTWFSFHFQTRAPFSNNLFLFCNLSFLIIFCKAYKLLFLVIFVVESFANCGST